MESFKVLRVGDPHVMVSNLEESKALMLFVMENAVKNQVRWVEFLGDLFHTHAVLRAEVVNFWSEIFDMFAKAEIPVRVIVGNHDQLGDKERENVHALIPFKKYPYVTIIDQPMCLGNGIAYLPYMANREEFVKAANELHSFGEKPHLLVCHQTFQGSTFENGFYAEDGIDLALINIPHIISGHIHKSQRIGKCFYPGTGKWDKATDAGSDKGIWLYEHKTDCGTILKEEFISTKEVVTPIYRIILKEGDAEIELPEGARIALELHGQSTWIATMKKKYKGKASIRAVPLDRKTVKMDGSKLVSIEDFAKTNFNPIEGVSRDDIVEYIRSLNGTGANSENYA